MAQKTADKAPTLLTLTAANIAKNLRLLCSEQTSVAEVCRRIGINRQQFNKYLAGQSLPSAKNFARICDYFEIERTDLNLPHSQFVTFRKAFGRNRLLAENRLGAPFSNTTEQITELERYCGMYCVYSMLPYTHPNMLLATCLIQRVGDRFISKYIERPHSATAMRNRIPTAKMFGGVTIEGGLVHILDRFAPTDAHAGAGYSLTILHTVQGKPVHLLVGMALSVAGEIGAAPFSSKIVYEKMPAGTDIRQLIRSSGRIDPDDPRVPREIARLTDNKITNDQPVLTHQYI